MHWFSRRVPAALAKRGSPGGGFAPAPEKRAAISMGTVTVSLPLCSVASSTPRMGPRLGRLIAQFHGEFDGVPVTSQSLRRGVLDAAVIVGKESQAI